LASIRMMCLALHRFHAILRALGKDSVRQDGA
jgi:hypothetical protein